MSKEVLALEHILKEYMNGDLDLNIPIEATYDYYNENERNIISDTEKFEMIQRGITAQEALQLFLDNSVKQGNKASTLKGKIKRIKAFVKYLSNYNEDNYYYINFSKIEPIVVSDYLSSRTRYQTSLHMSSSYSIIKTFFNYLTKEKVFVKNPMRSIHTDKFKKIGMESDNTLYYLNKKQLKFITSSLNLNTKIGVRFATIIFLMLDTGIQGHELANVKIHDIHLDKKILFITDENGIPTRQLALSNTTVSVIRRYIENVSPYNYNHEYLIRGIKTYEQLDARYISISLRRLGKKLEIKLSATVLRDTFAINYLEKTKDTITLASIMGISIYHLNARYKDYTESNDLLLGDLIYAV